MAKKSTLNFTTFSSNDHSLIDNMVNLH